MLMYPSLPTIGKDLKEEEEEENIKRNLPVTLTMRLWVKKEADLDFMARPYCER